MDLSFIQEQLDTKGYCIIPNILNKDEINIAIESFKEWQNSIPDHEHISKNINSKNFLMKNYQKK